MRGALAALTLVAGCAAAEGPGDLGLAPPHPCALTAPGAPYLAFVSRRTGDYDLFAARADGTCLHALRAAPSSEELSPAWGTGGRIAFVSDRGGVVGVWIHQLGTGAEWRVDTGALAAAAPAFSPDGATLAFEGRAAGGGSDIYVIPVEGGTPVQLTTSLADDAGPAWSPDGQTVYFVSSRTGRYDVHRVAASGGAATQVTDRSRIVGRPAVAPDGAALYFARTVAGASTTEVVRFALADATTTVVSAHDDSEPALSPGGDRLVVRTFRDGRADLVVADAADGGAAVAITADEASDGAPTFAPPP